MKVPKIFIYKKINNKTIPYISGKFAFFMFSTFGYPPELTEEIINNNLQKSEKIK